MINLPLVNHTYVMLLGNLGGAYKRIDGCINLKLVAPIYAPDIDWSRYVKERSNYIIFLNEDFNTKYSGSFVKEINNSDNIYVLITRKLPRRLTYSVYSIYNLVKAKNTLSLEKTLKFNSGIDTIKDLIGEDSSLGYRFVDNAFIGTSTNIIQSRGKSDVINNIKKIKGKKELYLFVDLESFGSMLYITRAVNTRINNLLLINIGSFEKAILDIYFIPRVFDILNKPQHYCDYKLYSNMERFFTELIKNSMKDINPVYIKI